MRIGLLLLAAVSLTCGQTALVVRVNPEARLSPSSANLTFQVDQPGQAVVSQPVTVNAWVRAFPGQQIQLMARVVSLTGPAGNVPVSALQWNGSVSNATGGGATASCTSGSFADSGWLPLAAGWMQSGILSCSVTFSLVTGAQSPVGAYGAQIELSLAAR
jgi:hypothetical protein